MVVATRTPSVERLNHDIDQIVNIDEIPSRVHDETLLTLIGDRRSAGAAQVPRPIGIRQPKRDAIQTAQHDVLFTARLADGIAAALRTHRMGQA